MKAICVSEFGGLEVLKLEDTSPERTTVEAARLPKDSLVQIDAIARE